MAKFWTCKYGSNHDIGERCDCREEDEKIAPVQQEETNETAKETN